MNTWQLQPEEIVAGRYRVIRALGSRRYLVLAQQETGQLVLTPLKLSDEQAVSRFEAEAARLCTLRHPRLASYVGHGIVERSDGYWGLLFQEPATGVSLAEWLRSGAAPSEERVVDFANQLLDGLEYLHEQAPPVVHGQLGPDYVLLDNASGPKLVAFGNLDSLETGGRIVSGAIGFVAPEALRGKRGPTSDLYALGALLVLLITRRSPAELPQREGRIDLRTVKASKWLAPIIERLLRLEPTQRFPSARSVALALERKATPISVKRMGILALVLTLCVALPAVGLAWYFARPSPKGPALTAAGGVKLPPRLPPLGPHVVSRRSYSGHLGAITNLAWLPDNEHFISAGYDGAIKLWHREHEEPLRSFSGQQGPVQSLALDPQGKRLAAGGKDGQLRVWSVETGKLQHGIAQSAGGIHDLEFSSDGRLLASTGLDGVARLHVAETGKLQRSFKLGSPGLAVAFSPDGKSFATTCSSPDITIWDRSTGGELFKLNHGAKVSDLKFTADGAGLISAGDDKRVVVWNVGQRALRHVIGAHRDEVWRIALSERAGLLATGGKGPLLVVSDPFKGVALEANRVAPIGFPALAFSPDGKYLLGGGANQRIWLFYAEKSPWFPRPVHKAPPAKMFVAPAGASPAEALVAEGSFEIDTRPDNRGLPRARALLDKARDLDPDNPMVLALDARVATEGAYLVGDKYEPVGLARARALAAKASNLAPNNPAVWRRVAYVAIARKELPDAVAAAAKARELEPDSIGQRRLELSIAEKDGSDQERLFTLARALVKVAPDDTYGLSILLDIYKARGEWNAVEQVYRSMIVLKPTSAWIHGNLANFYITRRRPKEAVGEAKRALAIMDYGVGHRILGDALLEQAHQDLRAGQPRAAILGLVQEAEQQRASPSRMFFVRGLLAWSDGDFGEASRLFKRAVETNENYSEARDALLWAP